MPRQTSTATVEGPAPDGGSPPNPPAAGAAPERTRPAVGRQIRRWRQDRHLTLAQVAERSGLNLGYLSQIENDKASPSLETLAALGAAIDVPITWFLIDSTSPPRVVRAGEGRTWAPPGGGRIDEVDGGIPRDLRIVRATIPVGASTGMHAHSGDEHHVMLAGRLRASQGPHAVEIGPGDYLLWDATIPHDVANIGDEPAVLLIIGHRAHGTETARPER